MMARLAVLSRITEEPGAITRRSYTPAMRQANELAAGWMREAGMAVREDPAGNICGRAEGLQPGPAVLFASHLDTVKNAGAYDGTLGVVAGIEAVQALREAGLTPPCAVEVAGFSDEEGIRFGATYLGSRALAGTWDPAWCSIRDADGISLAEAMRDFGLDPERAGEAERDPLAFRACYEVHIEQGPVLERANASCGIVTSIAAAKRWTLTIQGEAGHAGTVPMALRRDALVAAAELILETDRYVKSLPPGPTATIGRIEALPGAANCIPGCVRMTLDLRAPDDELLAQAESELFERLHAAARSRGAALFSDCFYSSPARLCAGDPRARIAQAVRALTGREILLTSGAGHDSAALATRWPIAMAFIRCKGGKSHCPQESITAEDAAAASQVLLSVLESYR